jgi:hypothetical protein
MRGIDSSQETGLGSATISHGLYIMVVSHRRQEIPRRPWVREQYTKNGVIPSLDRSSEDSNSGSYLVILTLTLENHRSLKVYNSYEDALGSCRLPPVR